ncbi:MAG: hypothetical protein WDW36_009290 [Sanguina aurantia]
MAPQAANRLREVHRQERGNASARAKRYRGSLKDQHKQLAVEKGRAWQAQQASKVLALQDQHQLAVSSIGQGQVAAQEFNQQRDRELQDAEARKPQQLLDEAARFAAALHSLHATRGEGQRRIQDHVARRTANLEAERTKASQFSAARAQEMQVRLTVRAEAVAEEAERRRLGQHSLIDFRYSRHHERADVGAAQPRFDAASAAAAAPGGGGGRAAADATGISLNHWAAPCRSTQPALLRDPRVQAEETHARLERETQARAAAASEAKERAQMRYVAAQAKLHAEASRRASEAELAAVSVQQVQKRQQGVVQHRGRLEDRSKQVELLRMFESNFLNQPPTSQPYQQHAPPQQQPSQGAAHISWVPQASAPHPHQPHLNRPELPPLPSFPAGMQDTHSMAGRFSTHGAQPSHDPPQQQPSQPAADCHASPHTAAAAAAAAAASGPASHLQAWLAPAADVPQLPRSALTGGLQPQPQPALPPVDESQGPAPMAWAPQSQHPQQLSQQQLSQQHGLQEGPAPPAPRQLPSFLKPDSGAPDGWVPQWTTQRGQGLGKAARPTPRPPAVSPPAAEAPSAPSPAAAAAAAAAAARGVGTSPTGQGRGSPGGQGVSASAGAAVAADVGTQVSPSDLGPAHVGSQVNPSDLGPGLEPAGGVGPGGPRQGGGPRAGGGPLLGLANLGAAGAAPLHPSPVTRPMAWPGWWWGGTGTATAANPQPPQRQPWQQSQQQGQRRLQVRPRGVSPTSNSSAALDDSLAALLASVGVDADQTPLRQMRGVLPAPGGGGLTGLTDLLDGPMMSPMSSQLFSPPVEGGGPARGSLGPDDPVGDSLLGWGLGPLDAWNPDPDGADSSLSSESLAGLADLIAKGILPHHIATTLVEPRRQERQQHPTANRTAAAPQSSTAATAAPPTRHCPDPAAASWSAAAAAAPSIFDDQATFSSITSDTLSDLTLTLAKLGIVLPAPPQLPRPGQVGQHPVGATAAAPHTYNPNSSGSSGSGLSPPGQPAPPGQAQASDAGQRSQVQGTGLTMLQGHGAGAGAGAGDLGTLSQLQLSSRPGATAVAARPRAAHPPQPLSLAGLPWLPHAASAAAAAAAAAAARGPHHPLTHGMGMPAESTVSASSTLSSPISLFGPSGPAPEPHAYQLPAAAMHTSATGLVPRQQQQQHGTLPAPPLHPTRASQDTDSLASFFTAMDRLLQPLQPPPLQPLQPACQGLPPAGRSGQSKPHAGAPAPGHDWTSDGFVGHNTSHPPGTRAGLGSSAAAAASQRPHPLDHTLRGIQLLGLGTMLQPPGPWELPGSSLGAGSSSGSGASTGGRSNAGGWAGRPRSVERRRALFQTEDDGDDGNLLSPVDSPPPPPAAAVVAASIRAVAGGLGAGDGGGRIAHAHPPAQPTSGLGPQASDAGRAFQGGGERDGKAGVLHRQEGGASVGGGSSGSGSQLSAVHDRRREDSSISGNSSLVHFLEAPSPPESVSSDAFLSLLPAAPAHDARASPTPPGPPPRAGRKTLYPAWELPPTPPLAGSAQGGSSNDSRSMWSGDSGAAGGAVPSYPPHHHGARAAAVQPRTGSDDVAVRPPGSASGEAAAAAADPALRELAAAVAAAATSPHLAILQASRVLARPRAGDVRGGAAAQGGDALHAEGTHGHGCSGPVTSSLSGSSSRSSSGRSSSVTSKRKTPGSRRSHSRPVSDPPSDDGVHRSRTLAADPHPAPAVHDHQADQEGEGVLTPAVRSSRMQQQQRHSPPSGSFHMSPSGASLWASLEGESLAQALEALQAAGEAVQLERETEWAGMQEEMLQQAHQASSSAAASSSPGAGAAPQPGVMAQALAGHPHRGLQHAMSTAVSYAEEGYARGAAWQPGGDHDSAARFPPLPQLPSASPTPPGGIASNPYLSHLGADLDQLTSRRQPSPPPRPAPPHPSPPPHLTLAALQGTAQLAAALQLHPDPPLAPEPQTHEHPTTVAATTTATGVGAGVWPPPPPPSASVSPATTPSDGPACPERLPLDPSAHPSGPVGTGGLAGMGLRVSGVVHESIATQPPPAPTGAQAAGQQLHALAPQQRLPHPSAPNVSSHAHFLPHQQQQQQQQQREQQPITLGQLQATQGSPSPGAAPSLSDALSWASGGHGHTSALISIPSQSGPWPSFTLASLRGNPPSHLPPTTDSTCLAHTPGAAVAAVQVTPPASQQQQQQQQLAPLPALLTHLRVLSRAQSQAPSLDASEISRHSAASSAAAPPAVDPHSIHSSDPSRGNPTATAYSLATLPHIHGSATPAAAAATAAALLGFPDMSPIMVPHGASTLSSVSDSMTSVEFGTVMASLLQDIHSGLATANLGSTPSGTAAITSNLGSRISAAVAAAGSTSRTLGSEKGEGEGRRSADMAGGGDRSYSTLGLDWGRQRSGGSAASGWQPPPHATAHHTHAVPRSDLAHAWPHLSGDGDSPFPTYPDSASVTSSAEAPRSPLAVLRSGSASASVNAAHVCCDQATLSPTASGTASDRGDGPDSPASSPFHLRTASLSPNPPSFTRPRSTGRDPADATTITAAASLAPQPVTAWASGLPAQGGADVGHDSAGCFPPAESAPRSANLVIDIPESSPTLGSLGGGQPMVPTQPGSGASGAALRVTAPPGAEMTHAGPTSPGLQVWGGGDAPGGSGSQPWGGSRGSPGAGGWGAGELDISSPRQGQHSTPPRDWETGGGDSPSSPGREGRARMAYEAGVGTGKELWDGLRRASPAPRRTSEEMVLSGLLSWTVADFLGSDSEHSDA